MCGRNVKANFVSRDVLEIGVSSDVICYNDGFIGLGKVFTNMSVDVEKYFIAGLKKRDEMRIKNMDTKAETKTMLSRKGAEA